MANKQQYSPTIKDVAKKAHVSIATVSLVVHNHKRIPEETKLRVNKVIKDLNYHPSRVAQGLVNRTTGNIGFILTDDHFLRSEPFYSIILLGNQFVARQDNYYILLSTVRSDFKEEDRLPRFILERNVDGLIIAGKVPDTLIHSINKYSLPTTFVDFFPSFNFKCSSVLIDNVNGGMKATEHLINLGHKNIAFIGGDIEHPSIRDRFDGYKKALKKAGIVFNKDLCIIDEVYTGKENGCNAAKKLLAKKKKITAIFTCNDAMAIGTIQCLKSLGYKIPEDISLVGFDDVDVAKSLSPPLTTIRVPKKDLGIEAIKLLHHQLKNLNVKNKHKTVPVELIVRGSTSKHIIK
jgi:LacI family transcriptional regulator